MSTYARARSHPARAALVAGTAAVLLVTLGSTDVLATVVVGTPGDDVSVGEDRDNASNTLIQPPGVTVPQHLDGTEVMFGRLGDDLLVGRTGSDVLVGGEGSDILVGGPDSPPGSDRAGSDVSLGDEGDDIAVWGTGDRSETFVGDAGNDTQIVGRLLRGPGGGLALTTYRGRQVPEVALQDDGQSCALTRVPAGQDVGEQYLLRVLDGGRMVATLRMRDVERVVCSSPRPGHAQVADLTSPYARFTDVPLAGLTGVVGAIVRR